MGARGWYMKKRWIAFAVALALSASLMPGVAEAKIDEYTLEQAEAEMDANGYDGYKADIPGTNFTMWYRDTMMDAELTEEGQAQGYLMVSIGKTCMLSVKLLDDKMTLEEYTKAVRDGVAPSAKTCKVNDVDFVVYDEPVNDGVSCRVAATVLPEGKILEFVYVYRESYVLTEIECSIASIRLKDQQK